MDKKLNEFFSELTEDEARLLSKGNINLNEEIDSGTKSRIAEVINMKTNLELNKPNEVKKHKKTSRPFRVALIAAVVAALLAVSVGATYKFVMPEGFFKDQQNIVFDSIYPVVDTEKAGENEIATVNKSVETNGYKVTFEAIAQGKLIRTVFENPFALFGKTPEEIAKAEKWTEIDENKCYAVFTIRGIDGKEVSDKDFNITEMGYVVAIKGYCPTQCLENYLPCVYVENNVAYMVCDVSDAQIFADRELHIGIFDNTFADGTMIRMDKNGDPYLMESYDGIKALFELKLDKKLADGEKAAAYAEEYGFDSNPDYSQADEVIAKDKAFKESGIDLSGYIGNNEWRGSWSLQFGKVAMAEEYLALQKARTDDMNIISGRDLYEIIDENANEEFYSNLKDFDYNTQDAKIPAEWIAKNGHTAKLSDGSEVLYVGDEMYVHFEKGGEMKLVVVPSHNIVVEYDMTVDSISNLIINGFLDENSAISYAYFYGYYLDGELTRPYLKGYMNRTGETEEKIAEYSKTDVETEEDAVYNLLISLNGETGIVEVIG